MLVLGILLPTVADLGVHASQNNKVPKDNNIINEVVSSDTVTSAGVTAVAKLTQGSQILKHIDPEVLNSNEHILRLVEEETLNSYAFLNRDGSKTVYYTDKAVKYRNADGTIIEKDVSLTSSSNGYTTISNDIGVLLPADPASGIGMSYAGYDITIVPIEGSLCKPAQNNGTSILYPDYFGTGMSLMYTPSLDGLKEDIVLSHYTGITTFSFRLFTDGLLLQQENGRYYLGQSQDADMRIDMGDVVAFDVRGRFSVGTMSVTTVTEGQEYLLTLSVDADFLTDETTTYPVSIDPTLTVSDNTHGANAIEDITLYSGTPNANCNWSYLHCGYYSSTYKVARTMFRLTGLISSSDYQSLSAANILSAQFYIQEATGTAAIPIHIYSNAGNSGWTETGASWNNSGHVLGNIYATVSPGSNQLVSYDITNLVKAWKNGTESAQAGFVLVSSNETSVDKSFYSSETAYTGYRSYVVVNYEVGNDFSSAVGINSGQTVSVNIATAGSQKYFEFTPFYTGFYTIQSSNTTGDPLVSLYNCNQVELAYDDDGAEDLYRNFALTYHFVANATYYISVGHYGTGTGSYDFIISSEPNADILSTDTLTQGSSHTVNINAAYASVCYTLTPSSTNFCMFQSYAGNGNAMIWIYKSDLTLIAHNYGGNGNNFYVEAHLAKDTPYYIVVGHYGSTTGSYSFTGMLPTVINTYAYNVKNTGSQLILDIHGPDAQEKAHQWSFHTGLQGQWLIEQETSGYYTIRSKYGNQYYLGISNSSAGVDNVILSPTVSRNTRWNIYETPEHTLIFEPLAALGKVLYAPNATVGSEMQLAWLDLTDSYCQWRIGGYNSFVAPYLPSRTFALQCIGELTTNSTWYPMVQAAVTAWNNSDAGVNIVLTTDTSKYTLEITDRQVLLAGDTQVIDKDDTPGVIERATITIGAQHLVNATEQRIISIISHELGHFLGLQDYSTDEDTAVLGNDSLMSYGRNYDIVTSPQNFDIRNVLFLYE